MAQSVFREVHHRKILLQAVIGFHFETPPIGPHRCTHAFFSQPISDLVGLDGVMERDNLEPKFIGHIEHRRHFIGTIAVHGRRPRA